MIAYIYDLGVCMPQCQVASIVSNSLGPHGLYPPGSSVLGIFQAKYWIRVPLPTPGDLPNPAIKTHLLRLLHWRQTL